MKKIAVALFALILGVGLGSYLYVFKGADLSIVEANPDFICKKAVTDMPCMVTSCNTWQLGGTRTCNGFRATEVAYYLIRTDCEAGYSKVSAGGNVGGNSGRQGADYISGSQSCSVVEIDTVSPVGEISE